MARILVSTKDLPHEKWLEYRRTGIGGSDASTIVGLNPYSSLYKLYMDKMGLLPATSDNEAMRQGRDFEEYVAKRFCEATGKKVRRRNFMFQHDKYDYILADIDRDIVGENAGLECKTTYTFNKADFESGEIPLTYYVQMTHYMAVMGYGKMYLAVLILGKSFYWFEVQRDEEEIESLITAESEFWNEYILKNKVPDIDGSEATKQTIDELNAVDNGLSTSLEQELLEKYTLAKRLADESKDRLDTIKNKIKNRLSEFTYGECNGYKISWKGQNKTTVDSKKLKNLYPNIYNKVAKTSTSRVLRISESED